LVGNDGQNIFQEAQVVLIGLTLLCYILMFFKLFYDQLKGKGNRMFNKLQSSLTIRPIWNVKTVSILSRHDPAILPVLLGTYADHVKLLYRLSYSTFSINTT